MKFSRIIAAILLISATIFFCWDYYMRSTWDDQITATFQLYQLKESGEEWAQEITSKKADELVEGVFPRQITIVKKDGRYHWESSTGERLMKSEVGQEKVYAKYTAPDEKDYIKVQTNMFEWAGCTARNHHWGSGNLQYHKILENGDRIIAYGHVYAYENPFQYTFCYEMKKYPDPIINLFSHIFR